MHHDAVDVPDAAKIHGEPATGIAANHLPLTRRAEHGVWRSRGARRVGVLAVGLGRVDELEGTGVLVYCAEPPASTALLIGGADDLVVHADVRGGAQARRDESLEVGRLRLLDSRPCSQLDKHEQTDKTES